MGRRRKTNQDRSQVSSFHEADADSAQVQLYSTRLIIARHYLAKMRGTRLDPRA
jgi:hypothetical protein